MSKSLGISGSGGPLGFPHREEVRTEPADVRAKAMDRDTLAENISAFIAGIAEGLTNGEATRAILVNVDAYVAALQAKPKPAKRKRKAKVGGKKVKTK